MKTYVSTAVFVHTDETVHQVERLRRHACGATIIPASIDSLMKDPISAMPGIDHAVVAGTQDTIKTVIRLSSEIGFSVGVIPNSAQKTLMEYLGLPKEDDHAVDLALRIDPIALDMVLCNDHFVLYKAVVGQMPLLDARV